MRETADHPTPERLEAFVEDGLDGADRAVVGSHVATCDRCRTEVTELRSLFEALAGLPELAPSIAFADRVMQGVRVRRPVMERVNEWIERLTPSTDRGWAFATALVAMPVVALAVVAWWILSHPEVSVESLWLVSTVMLGEATAGAWQWAWARFAASNLAFWAGSLLDSAASLGRGGLGLAAVMFATMTVASVYVLYENLFRTHARRTEHASYLF